MQKAQILKVRNTLKENLHMQLSMISTSPIEVWFEEENLRYTFESEDQLHATISTLTQQLEAA
jgi:hypothetical protein